MNIGLVTYEDLPNLSPSDQGLIPLFAEQEIFAKPVVWNRTDVNWSRFDYLILRSVWDSHLKSEGFSHWLSYLEAHDIKIFNPVSLVKYNLHKFYLRDLQEKGIDIIPTIFIPSSPSLDLDEVTARNWKQAVIKPAISAGSYLTERFFIHELNLVQTKYQSISKERDLLVQEFIPEILDFGEISLVYFNRKFSHGVRKTPVNGDFRVQIQYGGIIVPFVPEQKLKEQAERILSTFPGEILYGRVDGVMYKGKFLVMEVELIEPDLYFEFGEGSRKRLVDSFIEMTQ